MLQKFFIEFIINTSFLLLPLLVKISLYNFSVFSDWLNILLLVLILFQTYILAKLENAKKLYIFLLNIVFIFTYFLIRWLVEGFSFLQENIYIFFSIFVIINAIFRAYLYEKQLLVGALYNFFKVEIIPIFYYFVLVNENIFQWNIVDFFSRLENRVLAFIFTFFAIFYSLLIYSIRKKELEIENLHNLLKNTVKTTINGEELLKEFEKWKLNFTTTITNKVVVFMDIRGFTTWSEKNKNNPQYVINLLNNFYDIGEKYLKEFNWKINKFIWDAILYTFDDLENAIKFSQKTIKEEIIFLEKYGLKVGIWMNQWELIKWWVGSKTKKEETVIGDVVNTASRLEWWENEIRILKNVLPNGFKYKSLWKVKLKWKEKEEEIVSIYY